MLSPPRTRPPFHLCSSFLPGPSLSVCLWVCLSGSGAGKEGGSGEGCLCKQLGLDKPLENGLLSKGLLVISQSDRPTDRCSSKSPRTPGKHPPKEIATSCRP